MTRNLHEGRILAIALRSQRLGFAIIEGSVELVHWGMLYYEGNQGSNVAAAMRRTHTLFARFSPSRAAIERSKPDKAPNPENLQLLYRCIRREASSQPVPVSVLTRIQVRETFRDFGVRSKDDIAALLARMFPELQPRLPPKRKLWKREHFSMPMFDAVALAVAYWRHDHFQE